MATIRIKTSEKDQWLVEGDCLFPCHGKVNLIQEIKPGIYKLFEERTPTHVRVGLKNLSDSFDLGLQKIYKTGGEDLMEAIKKTWDSKIFRDKGKNLCSIFLGLKGTGKSVSAKILCNYFSKRYPVIIVGDALGGIATDFIQSIDFKCVVLIDEAEKVFSDNHKTDLLRLCDGVYNRSPKVVVMTMNDLNVDPNMISRPGRVRYVQKFECLPDETIQEIINDNLIDKSLLKEVREFCESFKFSSIDIIQSVVEEVNIHGNLETVKNLMNIDRKRVDIELLPFLLPKKDFLEFRDIFGGMKRNKLRGFNTLLIKSKWEEEPEMKDWLERHGSISLEGTGKVVSFQFGYDYIKIKEPGDRIPFIGTLLESPVNKFALVKLDFSEPLQGDKIYIDYIRNFITSKGYKNGDVIGFGIDVTDALSGGMVDVSLGGVDEDDFYEKEERNYFSKNKLVNKLRNY